MDLGEDNTMGNRSSRPLGRLGLAGLAMATAASGFMALAATTATTTAAGASSSEAPITIAMITSLTGPGLLRVQQCPRRLQRPHRATERRGRRERPQARRSWSSMTRPAQPRSSRRSSRRCPRVPSASSRPARCSSWATSTRTSRASRSPGGFFDGPEWGTQPFTNMFASDVGSLDPKYPVNTAIGGFLKAHGGTVVCSYGYGISPSSTRGQPSARSIPSSTPEGRRGCSTRRSPSARSR